MYRVNHSHVEVTIFIFIFSTFSTKISVDLCLYNKIKRGTVGIIYLVKWKKQFGDEPSGFFSIIHKTFASLFQKLKPRQWVILLYNNYCICILDHNNITRASTNLIFSLWIP